MMRYVFVCIEKKSVSQLQIAICYHDAVLDAKKWHDCGGKKQWNNVH